MSWYRDEEKEKAALTKKLQYQEELKAQMRANEEAKKLQKIADRSTAFVHPSALGIKPYARVSDNSHAILKQELDGGDQPRGRSISPPPQRERRRGRDRDEENEDESRDRRRSRRRSRDRSSSRGRERLALQSDSSDRAKDNYDFSSQLFRKPDRPLYQDDDYEPEPARGRQRSLTPPLRENRRREPSQDRDSNRNRDRSHDRGGAAPQGLVAKPSTKYMHIGFNDDTEKAKLNKKLQYQEELKAQMRANEEAKRLQKLADRSGVHVNLKPSNKPEENAMILYNANQGRGGAADTYDDPPPRRSNDRGSSYDRGSRDDYEDDFRARDFRDRFADLDRYDRDRDREDDRPQRGIADDALDMFKSRPQYDRPAYDTGYDSYNSGGGGGRMYDDLPPPPTKQVQWAPESVRNNPNPNPGRYGNNNNTDRNNSNPNHYPNSQQPLSPSGLKNDLNAGLSLAQQQRKSETASQYARDLQDQMEANKRRKEEALAKQKALEDREAKAAAEYNPWGKGGAGAPVRDSQGNVITNRKQAVQQAENNLSSPTRGAAPMQDAWNNPSQSNNFNSNPYNSNQNNNYNSYDAPSSNLAPSRLSDALSPPNAVNAGGGGGDFTRFKFSDMDAFSQQQALAKRSAKDSYQAELAAQVAAKKARLEEEERLRKKADEELEAKARKEIEKHNAKAAEERQTNKMQAMEAEQAAQQALQAKQQERERNKERERGGGVSPLPQQRARNLDTQPTTTSAGASLLDAYHLSPTSNTGGTSGVLGGDESYRSRAGGDRRRRRRRGARAHDETLEEDEMDQVLATENEGVNKILKSVELTNSASQPNLRRRDMMGATGLPAVLLRAPVIHDDSSDAYSSRQQHSRRTSDYTHGGTSSHHPHSHPQDAYITELKKQNALAQQQLAAAQAALRARGLAVGGGRAGFNSFHGGASEDGQDEDNDLLRAVGMQDALDLERRRMASRGGAVAAVHPYPSRSRPQSGYYPKSRPLTSQSEVYSIDETDDALQMLQKLNLGLPSGVGRDKHGHLAIASSARSSGGRLSALPSGLIQKSNMVPSDASVNFDISSTTLANHLGVRPRTGKSNPLEQSMAAHSHLVYEDHDVHHVVNNLFTSQHIASSASPALSAHPSVNSVAGDEDGGSGVGGAGTPGSGLGYDMSRSPSISARGQPSLSMGLDSYVAAERQHIIDSEEAAQGGNIVSAVKEEAESSQLGPHDHSAPSNPPTNRSYDQRSYVDEGAMLSSTAAAHGSNVVASVAVDDYGNPIENEPNYEMDAGFEQPQQEYDHQPHHQPAHHHEQQQHHDQQYDYQPQHHDHQDHGNHYGVNHPPDPELSSSPSMHRVRSAAGAAGASIMGTHSRPGSRPISSHRLQQSTQSGGSSRPASRPGTAGANRESQDAFAVEYATGASMDEQALPLQHHDQQQPPSHHSQPLRRSSASASNHPTSSASLNTSQSTRRSRKEKDESLTPSSGSTSHPEWRATKGGGGGLVKVDPEKRTVTTLSGAVYDGTTSGASTRRTSLVGTDPAANTTGRRKQWDKQNPSHAPVTAN